MVERGRAILDKRPIRSEVEQGWRTAAQEALTQAFGSDSANVEAFARVGMWIGGFGGGNEAEYDQERFKNITTRLEILTSLIDLLDQSAGAAEEDQSEPAGTDPGPASRKTVVFIGHGQSVLWARLNMFLRDDFKVDTVAFESEPRAGESVVPILEKMLDQATFAILALTAEDETAEGGKRARQNVVHEAGLFQGRLGFKKAILLVQRGLEEFSNVAGLQYIPFEGDRIQQTFWDVQQVLRREGQIP
jgi:predicted nucleotide-binding protein